MKEQTEERQIGRHLTEEQGVIGRGSMKDGEYVRALYVRYRKGLDRAVVEEKVGVEGHTYPEFAKYGKGKLKGRLTVEVAAEIRKAIIRGEIQPVRERRKEATAKVWTIDKLWSDWLDFNKVTKDTYRDETRYNAHLKADFGKKEPSSLVPHDIEKLVKRLRAEEYADDTIISVLGLLKRISFYGADRQLCPGVSFRIRVKGLKAKARMEQLTDEQTEQYREVARAYGKSQPTDEKRPQIAALVLLAIETGVRKGNLQTLKRSEIDLEKGILNLSKTKAGSRVIPISDAAIEILKQHLEAFPAVGDAYIFRGRDDGRLSDRQIRDGLEAIRDAAKLPEFNGKAFRPLHGARHALGSRLINQAVPVPNIGQTLGHKTLAVTMKYAHLNVDVVRESLNKANAESNGQK